MFGGPDERGAVGDCAFGVAEVADFGVMPGTEVELDTWLGVAAALDFSAVPGSELDADCELVTEPAG